MALHSVSAQQQRALIRILAGSWRRMPDTESISEADITAAAPLLLSTGAAALAWHRISSLNLKTNSSLRQLQEAYRLHSIQSAVHEHQLKSVFTTLRAAGVEPLLLKGWAMARLYPETGLRPYGDIDLWVCSSQANRAREVLDSGNGESYCIDLHSSFSKQYERALEDVFDRSRLVALDDVQIRLACPEDHLRYLCLHFLAHGAWRPLWLVDIALVVETRPVDLDWARCLGTTPKYADWVACVIGLAQQLLGADITGVPFADRAGRLPKWLVPAVLRQWATGDGMSRVDPLSGTMQGGVLRRSKIIGKIKEHWRNPIQASVELGAAFDERPRAPLQLAAGLKRLPTFTRELVRSLRRRA